MGARTDNTLVPTLRFPEFTDEYRQAKIRDVANISSGATPLRANKSFFENGNILWVKTTDLNNSLITDTEEKVTEYALQNTSLKIQPVGSVLVAMYGGFNQIGRTGLLVKEATTNQALSVINPNRNALDSLYLLMWMNKSISLWRKFAASSRKDPNITSSDVASFPVIFSGLKEQQKIADFLTAVDTKIQQLKRKHSLMLEYKKGVMQQLFSQQVRFKDDNGRDYPDWKEKHLGEALIPQVRENEKPNEPYLAIGVRSHGKGTFQKPDFDPESIALDTLFKVHENDLIVNITFAWEGAIAIVKPEDHNAFVSHRFPTYTYDLQITSHSFMRYQIQQKKFLFTLDLISPGGAGRNRVLSKKEFLKIKCDFPCMDEQQKIAAFLGAIDTKIQQLDAQVTQAETFKKGLLQQMFV